MKLALAMIAVAVAASTPASAQPDEPRVRDEPRKPVDKLASYFTALEDMKLVDVESGTLVTLKRELRDAEQLLNAGAYTNAAVALYAIVRSPRYAAFTEFVELQNAEYELAVALARAGSYGAALDAIDPILARGPDAPYWGPAHRRAVDIAIETRDHAAVLARLEAGTRSQASIPVSAAGERAYLRGRTHYDAGKLDDAERELASISKRSRMYSSALYLRGVIRARRGQWRGSAEALCEIAATPDDDKLTFVVDERYFTVKDLARLGLGRLAHERGEYDDAYYHYFQIPDDSHHLPDALFEAAWSMYQKRELATARDLVRELLREFPSAPVWPEASLLAGYVELADCKFDDSQHGYDDLVAKLQPIVDTLDRIRKDPDQRKQLFDAAVARYRAVKIAEPGTQVAAQTATTPVGQVLALLRLDPAFLRLHDAVTGTRELAAAAPATVRAWLGLGARVRTDSVGKVSTASSFEEDQRADAVALVEDLRNLGGTIDEQRAAVRRARRDGTLADRDAKAELDRLGELSTRQRTALAEAQTAADRAAAAVTAAAPPGLRPLIEADVAEARRIDRAAHALRRDIETAAETLAQQAIERLYLDTRKVLDKAKLGKIDAVIGQKRKLDIEVQDLAAGRFPEELIGRLWNAGMIGDDEEYWPWEGEYWADEYAGWR